MIDINHYCITNRLAPEANIPIYNIINTDYILGGAGNVARNLNNLDCNLEIITLIGNDNMGLKIKELLDNYNIKNKIIIDNRKTTQKYRLFNDNKLKVRYDIEDTFNISNEIENDILLYIKNKKEKIDAIILSDYNKGILSNNLCINIINYCNNNNIYTFIDPKIKNYIKYKNCFCFKPNLIEGESISNTKNIEDIFNYINTHIKCNNLILTAGENGIYLNKNNNIINIKHNRDINVIDVTGAGDITLCVIVYIYLLYNDIELASKVANYIAGESIQYIGNYNLTKTYIDIVLELINNY